jgi:signal transduction histidine kinase
VCTDLTEIKDLQEQVELQERMTVLGEMSAGIAHEFRNFMGTILGAAKLAAKQLPPHDPALESVQTILHVVKDMDHLITQFLNFARKTELDMQSVALEPWLARVVEQVRGQTPGSPPPISIQCSPNVPAVLMDEILMRQAVGNLVQNAIEATPESGRITLTAGVRPSPGRRREVELKVSDTGVGIPKSRLEKVFLPFFTTKTTGTGLGLALVHKIVLLHHGRIEVDSEEHKGTTFSIHLPIA